MACRACGLEHSPLERCEVARRRLASTREAVVHRPESVVHTTESVVHAPTPVVHTPRYRDMDARRAYRREWMRKRRQAGKSVA
jgi:hypothetical protein